MKIKTNSEYKETDTKLNVEYKETKLLIPYANNARTHNKEQVNQIAKSITKFGVTTHAHKGKKD